MTSVGLDALERNLAEYIRRASEGETVVVTEHDRPVAEIVPPRLEHRTSQDENGLLAELIREGKLTPRRRAPGEPLPPRQPMMPLAQLLKELDADRADR